MEFNTAKDEIRRQWRQIMPEITIMARHKIKGEPTWICPHCQHGANKGYGMAVWPEGAGNTTVKSDGNVLHCWGCGWTGDIIKLYAEKGKNGKRNLSDQEEFIDVIYDLADLLGLSMDEPRETYKAKHASKEKKANKPVKAENHELNAQEYQRTRDQPKMPQNESESESEASSTLLDYIKRCQQDLSAEAAQKYLQGRCISNATAVEGGLGYDNNADPANNPGGMPGRSKFPQPRIIIPTNTGYVAKAIQRDIDPKYKDMNPKGCGNGIFNLDALSAHEVREDVFVTEGAFDALSLMEVGRAAVALNSVSNIRKLVDYLRENPTEKKLIICMDNDQAGRRASKELSEELQSLKVSHVTADICRNYKDPNDALQANPSEFLKYVEAAEFELSGKPDNVAYYIQSDLMKKEIADFGDPIKTGYANLDAQIGGLYPGLYCLAAISSIGKTTYCHQMADQMAAAGHDVLFFALEQSRLEMVTKSIAREMAKQDLTAAMSSLDIRRGYTHPYKRPDVTVDKAMGRYIQAVGDRISVIEGNFSSDITSITNYIKQYCRQNDARPVVMIDYLQLLQPETDEKGRSQSTKEAMDNAIMKLKQLSRQLNIAIVVISSVNRANYLTPISMECIKESGGIEYTCDVVWGLQLACLHDDIFEGDAKANVAKKREAINQAKAENPRRIEIVGLKNRFGKATYSCLYDYYSGCDYFIAQAESEFNKTVKARKPGRRL